MVRKQAPQPLSLPDLGAATAASGGSVSGSASLDESYQSPASTLTSPDSVALGRERRSPRPAAASEATLQVVSPSTSAKSPKSPRSPFSKFNPSRKPPGQGKSPTQTTAQAFDVQQQPPQLADRSVHAAHQQPPPQHQQQPQQRQQQHQYSMRQEPTPRPKTAGGHPPPPVASTEAIQRSNQTYNQTEHSRSASRFLKFNKGSRSNNQLHQIHTTPPGNNSEAMSRGAEYPAMPDKEAGKKAKQSGK
jgi:hypothetical protein